MPTIGELIINLNASTAAFVTELDRVKNLSFDTAKQVQRSFNLIGTAAIGMIGVAAGALAVGIEKTVEWETHILHLAEAAGTSTEAMSGLSFAAKMMGLDIDQIAKAMERFDKQILAAQAGNVKAGQNMSILGVDVSTLKTSDEALMKLADHIAAMPDGIARTAAAAAAFGVKLGPAMIPLLAQGSKGIQDFMAEAGRMGLVITKDQAEQAEHFEQNVTRMKESLHGLWVELTNATLPILDQLTTKFEDTVSKSGKADAFWEFIGAAFGGSAGEGAMGPVLGEGQRTPTSKVGPLPLNTGDLGDYLQKGAAIIAQQEDERKAVDAASAATASNQKAVDALKKSYDSLVTTYQTNLDTLGKTALETQIYKINTDAAKAGVAGLTGAEVEHVRALNTRLIVFQKIAEIDNQTRDEQKKNFLANRLALDLQDLDVMKKQLDLVMQPDFSGFGATSSIGAEQQTEAFTQAYQQQMSEVQHSIATWGMTTDQVTRYNMSLLDSSAAAAGLANNVVALQDKLAHMENVTAAWKEFESIANRTLDELIFSGKSLGDVLKDLVKQLGEMALKWALLGPPGDKGNGGIFGALFSGIKGIFGLAGGGSVAGGQTVLVGEEGPELFTPSTSGTVIPNGSIGGRGAQVNYYIDARGSSITEEQFRRSLAATEGRAVQRSMNMVKEAQART